MGRGKDIESTLASCGEGKEEVNKTQLFIDFLLNWLILIHDFNGNNLIISKLINILLKIL